MERTTLANLKQLSSISLENSSDLVLRKNYLNVRPLKVNECILRVHVCSVCMWVPNEKRENLSDVRIAIKY